MAGQWFALPKLFNASKNEGYEIVKNDKDVIQFKNEQSWTFKAIPKTTTIDALVSLSLDPMTVDSDFIQIKYHKEQANDKNYSHEGQKFSFKSECFQEWRVPLSAKPPGRSFKLRSTDLFSLIEWQADNVAKNMDSKEAEYFVADKDAGKKHVKTDRDRKGESLVRDI
jgi:hypothetical protein